MSLLKDVLRNVIKEELGTEPHHATDIQDAVMRFISTLDQGKREEFLNIILLSTIYSKNTDQLNEIKNISSGYSSNVSLDSIATLATNALTNNRSLDYGSSLSQKAIEDELVNHASFFGEPKSAIEPDTPWPRSPSEPFKKKR